MGSNTYTNSGANTWTVPANVTEVTVEIWGAGGGGAGSNTNSTAGGSGGGGGGAYVRLVVSGLVPGNVHGLNVGAGGAGGPAGNNNGSPGGTSNFYNNSGGNTAIIVGANAGAGGINAQNTGNKAGLGGAANDTVGTSYKGGNGANNGGTRIGGGAGAGAGNANAGADSSGQTGATGANGGGNGGNGGARNANGNAFRSAPGAGGGGAGQSNGTARAGGLGANGQVIISWAENTSLEVQDAYCATAAENVGLTFGYSPDMHSGMVAWHQADTLGLSDGADITSWPDASPHGYSMVQTNTNDYPIFKTNIKNGLGVARFASASSQTLGRQSGGLLSEWRAKGYGAIFFVFKPTSATQKMDVVFIESGTGVGRFGMAVSETGYEGEFTLFGRRLDGDTAQFVHGGTVVADEWHICCILVEWANAIAHIRLDGEPLAESHSFQTSGVTSDTDSWSVSIGSSTGASYMDGDIAEVIWYNEQVTEAEAELIEEWLNDKWNVYTAGAVTLTVQDAHCDTQADNVVTVKNSSLVVNDAFCETQSDNVITIKNSSLVVDDAYCTTQTDNVVINKTSNLVVDDAYCTSAVDPAGVLAQVHNLVVNDAFSTSQTDNVVTTKQSTLVIDDAYCTSQTDAVVITQTHILVVDDAYSTTQSDNVVVEIPSEGQKLAPSADVTDGNWTNESGSQVNLFESLNEESASDSDYVQSEYHPDTSPMVVKFSAGSDPQSSSGHILRYRIERFPSGSEELNLTIQLRQGYVNESNQGTLIAEWTESGVGDTLSTIERTLTGTQADLITSYSDLFLRAVADT